MYKLFPISLITDTNLEEIRLTFKSVAGIQLHRLATLGLKGILEFW